ncbi:MAG: polyprenyl synthetase family protein [Chloroflexi bacterium]|nr:polyprenyl synthetase family protein [Chloroflexota bacterium]
MLELSEIYGHIQEDLYRVEDLLESMCLVNFPHLSALLGHSLRKGGKKLRPVLTLLSGKFYDYDLDRLLPMAASIEILHSATLVHDDAIDKSSVRRGQPTVNALWGEEQAVLLGDYLFAEAGALTASTGNLRVIKLFAETLKTISSGELNQALNAFNLEQSPDQYYERVGKKTAALFAMATESGAVLGRAPEESVQVLIRYGYGLGIAFQIIDDVLDFTSSEEELGKPVGSDLTQGTFTLPAMLLLKRYPRKNPVTRWFRSRTDPADARQAIEMVRNSPAIVQECFQIASGLCEEACRDLKLLPACPSRQSLYDLANYMVQRRK